ncbi:MAG: AAA-like domain-containing protein [Bacteroidia bacterium]|nr:AAA-like domain-containing protein [Bacteroidia bacterium]
MKKEFNITGTCLPGQHYMMDASAKLAAVMAMIEAGKYFTISRPRQYGKTTMLAGLHNLLGANPKYLPIRLDLQGVDAHWYSSDSAFAEMFVKKMHQALGPKHPSLAADVHSMTPKSINMDSLSDLISEMAYATDAHLVLLMDEVDSSSNFDPFLRFLGMLRAKYLRKLEGLDASFHSVVLAGVHHIKSLKLKVRSDDTAQYNSPWNIAADFKVEMSFRPHEIAPMLKEYSQAEGVEIDVPAFAEKLYYYTSGYPFLVSKLCKTIAEDLLPQKAEKTAMLAPVYYHSDTENT